MKKMLFSAVVTAFMCFTAAFCVYGQEVYEEGEGAYEEVSEEEEDEINYSVLLNNKGFINFVGQKPVNIEGRVFVPVRGVFEEMGFEVDFDAETKTASIYNSLHDIEMTLGNEYFTVDGRMVYPEVPQFIMNKSFMIPLRAVAEAVGAVVGYNHQTKIITISYEPNKASSDGIYENTTRFTGETAKDPVTEAVTEVTTDKQQTGSPTFTINATEFRFGQTRYSTPSRKLKSPYGFTWYVYNSFVNQYYMLGINDEGEIVAFYTQTPSFSFQGVKKGDTDIKNPPSLDGYTIKYYVRKSPSKLINGRLYAIFACKSEYMTECNYDDEVMEGIYDQLYSIISAFRASEGIGPIQLVKSKHNTAKQHSDDLCENNGTAAVSFEQKLVNTGVYIDMPDYGLFETSASAVFYLDIIDNILANSDAYQDIIYGGFYEIDMGLSLNEISNTLYYAQNLYVCSDDYYNSSYDY